MLDLVVVPSVATILGIEAPGKLVSSCAVLQKRQSRASFLISSAHAMHDFVSSDFSTLMKQN